MKVCTACGHLGTPKTHTEGSILIEIILWCTFLVPGLLYSLWRMTSGRKIVCEKCGNSTLVPKDSPMGRKILADLKALP